MSITEEYYYHIYNTHSFKASGSIHAHIKKVWQNFVKVKKKLNKWLNRSINYLKNKYSFRVVLLYNIYSLTHLKKNFLTYIKYLLITFNHFILIKYYFILNIIVLIFSSTPTAAWLEDAALTFSRTEHLPLQHHWQSPTTRNSRLTPSRRPEDDTVAGGASERPVETILRQAAAVARQELPLRRSWFATGMAQGAVGSLTHGQD